MYPRCSSPQSYWVSSVRSINRPIRSARQALGPVCCAVDRDVRESCPGDQLSDVPLFSSNFHHTCFLALNFSIASLLSFFTSLYSSVKSLWELKVSIVPVHILPKKQRDDREAVLAIASHQESRDSYYISAFSCKIRAILFQTFILTIHNEFLP